MILRQQSEDDRSRAGGEVVDMPEAQRADHHRKQDRRE